MFRHTVFWSVLTIFVVIGLMTSHGPTTPTTHATPPVVQATPAPAPTPTISRSERMANLALVHAKQEVTRLLGKPTTGQFPSDDTVHYSYASEPTWVMHSIVGTRNAAGKLVRVPWSAVIYFDCPPLMIESANAATCWKADIVRINKKVYVNGKPNKL